MREPILYKDETIHFTRGQPMGILSSWAIATLTHHALIRWASVNFKVNLGVSNYMILGDDNVIIGSDLITAYEKMCKSLGLEMSSSKTIKTKGEGFEFCKKIFRKGVNITPIS